MADRGKMVGDMRDSARKAAATTVARNPPARDSAYESPRERPVAEPLPPSDELDDIFADDSDLDVLEAAVPPRLRTTARRA